MNMVSVQWSLAEVAVRTFNPLWAVFIYPGTQFNLNAIKLPKLNEDYF